MSDPIIDKFFIHLIDCRDTDNLIIKGHILTEHALNFFIEMQSVEKMDKNAKFTYSNKIEIAQILGLFKNNHELKKELKLLNKLRNSIAHNLKYDKDALKQFLLSFKKVKDAFKDGKTENLEDDEEVYFEQAEGKFKVSGGHMKFMLLICYMCGQIFSLGSKKDNKENNNA